VTDLEFSKEVRIPIHGYVGLTEKEVELVDSFCFQRLRKIKQLANTHLVYPGATHSRFEHSLGALETGYQIARRIKSICNDEDKMRRLRYAILLHDIGHGPFSHVFEDIVMRIGKLKPSEFSHELVTVDLLCNDEELMGILGSDLDGVVDLLRPTTKFVEHHIVSGPLDADKIDYLQRDSYHAGVAYGVFDAVRVIHTLKEIPGGFLNRRESYLGASIKGREAIIGMQLAYYYMHEAVYSHKTRRIADAMLIRSIELAATNDESFDTNIFQYTQDDKDFLESFKKLDDRKLVDLVLESSDKTAHEIIESLNRRKLFKAVFGKDMSEINPQTRMNLTQITYEETKKLEEALGEYIGIDPNFIIVDRQSIDNPLYREPYGIPKTGPIYFETEDGKVLEFADIPSPLSRTRSGSVERFWVYAQVKEDERKEKEKLVEDFINSSL